MNQFALSPARKLLLASAVVAFPSLASMPSHAQPDPPAQAGRISYITGNVSIQPVGSDNWGQAFPNLPLGPGDRIFTDYDGRAEIQVGQTFVRIGPNSDVSLVDSTPAGLYFGVAQGSVHLHTLGLWQDQSVYVNTPSGSSILSTPGELRVDVMPDQYAAVFTDYSGFPQITGAGDFQQGLTGGQALELIGSNPVTPQWLEPADWDSLDNWSHQRDQQVAQSMSYRYLSPEIPGGYEMDAAGTWMPGTPYGAIWFPNNVAYGWAPYHYGHWVNHVPWGWVWVEDESWGYAPFHYGRWVSWNGRWGWIPGPPAAHPVWSPALVVFAGGMHGVSAWFPLGPGEPYRPSYPCSQRYMDQVNITNIVEAPRVHVQTTYVNINVVNVTYINRTTVTAVNNADFASGRPVAQASVVVNTHAFDHVQVLAAPEPRPTPQSFVGRPPARPVPVSMARPVLINEKGMAVSATPGARPLPPPVKPAPPVRALAGHTVVAPPPGAVKPQPQFNTTAQPMRPQAPLAPATIAPAKPAPVITPKAAPLPMEKPVIPPSNGKPEFESSPKAAPLPPSKPVTEPNGKPPAPPLTKPAGAPAPPPKVVKPGDPPPPKTDKEKDKNKKDDKDKEKDKE